VSITTSAELRAAIERHFEKRFGVEVEPVVGRAPNVIRKMIEESKGGVRYVDVHIAAKDIVTIDQYYKRENQSEDEINRLRERGAALARKLLD
jgi:hypothetical protein